MTFSEIEGTDRTPASDRGAAPSNGRVEAALQQLLEDDSFTATPDRRRLLGYIVSETLAGRVATLKGVVIAQDVFGRGAEFDPQSDPVVRIEAHRLRRDLDSFYANHGNRATIRISIPKGAYVAHFEEIAGLPFVPTDEPAEIDPVVSGGEPPSARSRKWWPYGLALVASIFAVAFASWLVLGPRKQSSAISHPGIAVEQFTTLGGSEELGFFAEGLSHELVDRLMRFGSLDVYAIPPGRIPLSTTALDELNQDQHIDYFASGTLSADGTGSEARLVVLLKKSDGKVLWSGTYDSDMSAKDSLRLQDELAGQIASTLAQTYGIVASDIPASSGSSVLPSDPTFNCLQRAQHYRRAFDVRQRGPARECLERAVERDPQVSEVWAMLGWVLLETTLFERVDADQRQQLMERSLAATEEAVRLAPNSELSLQSRAATLFYSDRFQEAESAIRRAFELNPNDPEILHQMGWRLAARGNLDEGIGYLKEAISRSIDPPARYFNFLAIDALVRADFPEMLAHAQRSAGGGSPVGNVLLAIALKHAPDGSPEAIAAALSRAGERQPKILSHPEQVFAAHKLVPSLADQIIDGMMDAGWQP